MELSWLDADNDSQLIVDATFLINLLATDAAGSILSALPVNVIAVERAIAEVTRCPRDSMYFSGIPEVLASEKNFSVQKLPVDASDLFVELVSTPPTGLGDGEAATLSYAAQVDGIVATDDRRARAVAREKLPNLRLTYSIELLLTPLVEKQLGHAGQVAAVYDALIYGRMRVPREFDRDVRQLIGPERAANCSSLINR